MATVTPDEVRKLYRTLVRPGRRTLQTTVQQQVAEDVKLKNPFFAVTGKDRLYNLFRFWEVCLDDQVEIPDAAVHGNRALLKVEHKLTPRPLAGLHPSKRSKLILPYQTAA